MNKIISLFVDSDRTYFTKAAIHEDERTLEMVGTLPSGFRLDAVGSYSIENITEIQSFLTDNSYDIQELAIIYPESLTHSVLIPFQGIEEPEVLSDLIQLETERVFPTTQLEDLNFDFYVTGLNNILVIISERMIQQVAENYFRADNYKITHHFSEHISAANTFIHNYENYKSDNVLLVSFGNNFLNYTAVRGGQILLTQKYKFPQNDFLIDSFTKAMNEIQMEIGGSIGKIMLYGNMLNKSIFENIQKNNFDKNVIIQRLNPFQIFYSALDERKAEYAERTMQFFPSCIGSALPEKIK